MEPAELAAALASKQGTIVEEWQSEKGPVRYWWVEDNIPAMTTLKWTSSGAEAVFCDEFREFSAWCRLTYVDQDRCRLVACSYVPEMEAPREDDEELAIPVVAISIGLRQREFESKTVST